LSRRARDAGFTLIEVLAALAIAALGLGAMMAAVGTGLANTSTADRYLKATRQAQSLLALTVAEPLEPGQHSGTYEDGSAWRVRVSPPLQYAPTKGTNGAKPAAIPGLYAIEATVSWPVRGSSRSVTLHTQRLAPAVPAGG
jgi:general secretion pathway protein I